MRLRYTKKATEELAEVLEYIALRSPQGEQSVSTRIRDMIDLLLQFPTAGQLTTRGRLRRLAVTHSPYLIFYRVDEDTIVIHGIRHAARKPSSMPN